jgi:hypothetical protein
MSLPCKLGTTIIVMILLLWVVAGIFQPTLFILLFVVLGPIAFYRKFINKETRTVGHVPMFPGVTVPPVEDGDRSAVRHAPESAVDERPADGQGPERYDNGASRKPY